VEITGSKTDDLAGEVEACRRMLLPV